MTADEYWEKLIAVGWVEFIPPDLREEIRAQLATNLAADSVHAHLALTTAGFDAECIDHDHAYRDILKQFGKDSQGVFAPTSIKDTLDESIGIARISFVHGGKKFSREVPFTGDYFEMEVLDLVNDALAANEVEARFIPFPSEDQLLNLVFVPPRVFQEAARAGLVPKDNEYLREVEQRKAVADGRQPDPKLVKMLRSETWGDRHYAVIKLGATRAKAKAAFPLLAQALHDEDHSVKWCAADALARVGKDAIPALESVLSDRDRYVGVKVAACLLAITKHTHTRLLF